MQGQPAVEDDGRHRRKSLRGVRAGHREHDVGAVTRGDHGGTFAEPLEHVIGGHASHHHVHHLARHQGGVAVYDCAGNRRTQFSDGRCHQQGLLGKHVHPRSQTFAGAGDRRHLVGLAAVGDHGRGVSVLGVQLGQAQFDGLSDLLRSAAEPAHRQHHRRAEVDGDAGVDTEFGGGGDIGVVGADNHYGVAPVGDVVVAVDDVGDRGVGVGVQALIAHADAVGVGKPGTAGGQQQLEDVVGVLAAGDRPEHPDPRHHRREPVHDAQSDGGLAGLAFRRGDVDGDGALLGAGCVHLPSLTQPGFPWKRLFYSFFSPVFVQHAIN